MASGFLKHVSRRPEIVSRRVGEESENRSERWRHGRGVEDSFKPERAWGVECVDIS